VNGETLSRFSWVGDTRAKAQKKNENFVGGKKGLKGQMGSAPYKKLTQVANRRDQKEGKRG